MTTIISPSTTASSRKPSIPGQPWSHLETIALIDAYESKWYSLKRGQLKTHQWDEVAVAARCNSPQPFTKSATQCRHKIEKLRKRFRAEKNRPVPSLWPYFNRIDRMERGPLPVPVPISVKAPSNDCQERDDDEDRVGVLVEVSKEVRRFGEGMVRVEKRRMEMMKEEEEEEEDVELSESYTCVIAHVGEGRVRKREYFGGGGDEAGGGGSGIGCKFGVSSGVFLESPEVGPTCGVFLSCCFLCRKKLFGIDIFMYSRGEAFCSVDCRCQQILNDDYKKKCRSGATKARESFVYRVSLIFNAGVAAA